MHPFLASLPFLPSVYINNTKGARVNKVAKEKILDVMTRMAQGVSLSGDGNGEGE